MKPQKPPLHPTHKGEKFRYAYTGEVLTIKAFMGRNEVDYDTYDRCKAANTAGGIYVKTEQYSGTLYLELCQKIDNFVVQDEAPFNPFSRC